MERMDSVRRRRRGRRVRSACSILRLSVLDSVVFIFFLAGSPEKVARAARGAEAAAGLLERAVFAEPFAADHASLENHRLRAGSANEADLLFQGRHERAARNFRRRNLLSILRFLSASA